MTSNTVKAAYMIRKLTMKGMELEVSMARKIRMKTR
jgi:hypothetical protein